MPLSPSPPSSGPNRNTLNQRASRARRKTYIGELEHKVRTYESQGVKATEEVQRAARRVADENRILREQIQALRVRNAELEALLMGGPVVASGHGWTHGPDWSGVQGERLQSSGPKATEQQYPSPPQMSEMAMAMALTKDESPTTANAYPTQLKLQSRQQPQLATSASSIHATVPGHAATLAVPSTVPSSRGSIPGHDMTESTASTPYSDDGTVDMDDDEPSTKPQPQPPVTQPSASVQEVNNANTGPWSNSTSCAQAAMIIASMRGLPSADDFVATEILSELGCAPRPATAKSKCCSSDFKQCSTQEAQHCMVDNAKLFGILDQEERLP
ncbi:hypothetical protein H2202_006332 [Exophiala xenobiotica]|nr:hypothetical protein H2202_006332 [Exophiala xenobiotica]KAK5230644.1 hypothetical protein LTR47_007498 [Exophiala xenobiotica]KAK5247559.1 hypothetical protein LTS06_007254 [Exophiala xenobiotica]KAK5258865.1 hypothetical protein LTR40_007058 [Exophiala xenobiotica]KAK5347021.1 hypothetical protein LTR61_009186 [Exophiala xenobiotica]